MISVQCFRINMLLLVLLFGIKFFFEVQKKKMCFSSTENNLEVKEYVIKILKFGLESLF